MKKILVCVLVALPFVACGPAPETPDETPELGAAQQGAGPCGSSYILVGHYPIRNASGTELSYIDVYWSSTAGRNCAVNMGNSATWGQTMFRAVGIALSSRGSGWDAEDRGNYAYYAGPVYSPYSVGKCVDVYGQTKTFFNAKTRVHCG
jgi:hypothetical protein